MDSLAVIRERAPNVALQFSGGRDSLAMLLLLRPVWDCLTVYYTTTGDAFPETLALAKRVAATVPNFAVIRGDVRAVQAKHGWPTDVLQAGAMWPYGALNIADHLRLVDRYFCCYESIMAPMHARMKADGITTIVRGQRDSDEPKSHVRHGETVDGFTILYPIADWSTEQVELFIHDAGWTVPPYYPAGMTSAADCMHCTAWLEHGAAGYLRKNHPDVAAEVRVRLDTIKRAVTPFLRNLDKALEQL